MKSSTHHLSFNFPRHAWGLPRARRRLRWAARDRRWPPPRARCDRGWVM